MNVAKLDLTRLNELRAELRPKADKLVGAAAFKIEGSAKMRVPVKTHFLQNSILARRAGELAYRVDVYAEYGAFVELGTSKMAARPYLVPAVEAEAEAFRKAWAELFE